MKLEMIENGSLADLPGVWGRQRPKLQSLTATCAAGGAKPEVSQSALQTDLVESKIQASRRRGIFHGGKLVDQNEKGFLADLPPGNRLRFQANLRGMY